MIVVTLMGGLGNQMFQYACGKHLARQLNRELLLNTAFLHDHQNHPDVTPRDFELEVFKIGERTMQYRESFGLGAGFPYRLNKALDPLLKKMSPVTRVNDNTELEALLRLQPKRLLLEGYFQSETYFKASAAEIRSAFTFKHSLSGENKALAEQISASQSVSLHVRRGDYVKHEKTAAYHGICSPEYYKQALELMSTRHKDLHFFVFSDDMNWTRANLPVPGKVTYVDHNHGKDSYRDMQLMSLCRHQIIANSSFSWWGAWLNPNQDKTVIAPARWFNHEQTQNNIVPASWIKI